MPYIGQRPTKGDENNFKILDDISSYTLTFDGSSASVVSAANDTITSLNHRFITGQRVTYTDGDGSAIAGLTDATVYFIIKEDHNTIKLATSASNAANGTAVNITNVGSGSSHTLNVAFDGVNTKFKATHTNGVKAKITRSAQLVISINGVIQQPHDSTEPSTGFGFDLDGTIVFSQAPASSDVYWAHVLTNNNVTFDISDNTVDNFTGDGSTTDFNLSKVPPNNQNVLVTIDGVLQYPDSVSTIRAYTIAANVLKFTTAPANYTEIQVRHIGFAGASTAAGVSAFYGRSGNAVLKSTDNISVGNITSSGNISANDLTLSGDLTVNGDFTTLNTTLREVELLRVSAASTLPAGIITQTGTGDILNLYDGSTEVFSVSDGGNLTLGGGIIYGDDSAFNVLTLQSTSGNANHSRIEISKVKASDNGGIHFYTAGSVGEGSVATQRMIIKGTSGDIGIGTDAPGAKLDVRGNIIIQNTYPSIFLTDTDSSDDFSIQNQNGVFAVRDETNSENRLNIDSDGKVGIGTAIPAERLSVEDSSPAILINATSATGESKLQFGRTGNTNVGEIKYEHSNNAFTFRTNDGADRLRITSGGAVQIGNLETGQSSTTHTSATKLHIDSTKSIKIARLAAGNISSAGWFTVAKVAASNGNYFKCYASIGGDFTADMCVMELTGSYNASGALQNTYAEPVFKAYRTGLHSTDRITRARLVKDGSNLLYLQIYIASGHSSYWGKSVLEYQIGAYSQNTADSGSAAMFAAGGSVTNIRTLEVDDNAICVNSGSHKFYSGGNATERVTIKADGGTALTRTHVGGRQHTGNTSNYFKIGTWKGFSTAGRAKITVFGTSTFDSGTNNAGESIIYLAFAADNTMHGHFHSISHTRKGIQKVAYKITNNNQAEVWIKYNGSYAMTKCMADVSIGTWEGNDVDTGSTSTPNGATEANIDSRYAIFTSDGSQSNERLRIDKDGKIGFNEDSPSKQFSYAYTESANYSSTNAVYEFLLWNKANISSYATCGASIQLRAGNTSAGGGNITGVRRGPANQGDLAFSTTNVDGHPDEKLRITSAGNVGINRTNPDQRLNINGNIETNAYDNSNGGNGYYTAKGLIIGNAYDASKTGTSDDRNAIIWQERGLNLDFATQDTHRMVIDYKGIVGVGTHSPYSHADTTAFQVHDDYNDKGYPRIRLTNKSSGSGAADGYEMVLNGSDLDAVHRQRENADIYFIVNNSTEALRILNDGNVGIGYSIPNAKLHIASGTSSAVGDSTNPAFQIGNTTNYRFAIHTTNEEAIIANKNGDDGISFHTKAADAGSFGEALRIKSNGEMQLKDSTVRYENTGGGFNQVRHLEFPIYFSSGTEHTVATIGGSLDSGFVAFAVLEYIGLYGYAGQDMSGGVRRAYTRRNNNNSGWRDFDDQVSENYGENYRPTLNWDSGVLKVTTGNSVQITGYIRITAHAINMANFTLTRN